MEHQCSCQRSIGYYMEAILCLAPFGKKPLSLKLTGVTNDDTDPSVSAGRQFAPFCVFQFLLVYGKCFCFVLDLC